jgi:large subunit ribosomal protein L10
MAFNLEQKRAVAAAVADVARHAHSAVAAEYRGLTVGELTALRARARAARVYLKVIKNTLARRGVQDTEFACLHDTLVGPVLLAFSLDEPATAPRILNDFAKEHQKLVIKGGAFKQRWLSPAEVATLARMPTREQALSQLMAVMKAPVAKLLRTLAALRDQRQTVQDGPPGESG